MISSHNIVNRYTKVRFIKKNGYTVATTDQPVTMEAIKEALAEFP